MSSIQPLDTLIRRVPSRSRKGSPSIVGKILIFDVRHRRVLPKPPILQPWREVRYYLVSTESQVELVTDAVILKRLDGRSLELEAKLFLECAPNRENTLVQCLASDDSTLLALNKLVARRLEQQHRARSQRSSEPSESFSKLRDYLEQDLCTHLIEEAGLLAQCQIRPAGGELKPINLTIEAFSVRVMDNDDALSLEVTTTLDVAQNGELQALLLRRDEHKLGVRVKESLQRFFQQAVTLHEFHFERTERLRDKVLVSLDRTLAKYGRQVSYLKLHSDAPTPEARTLEIERTVECTIRGTKTKIPVHNTIRLRLRNSGLWERSGFESLDAWWNTEVVGVIQDHLFDKTYVGLLLDFTELAEQIKTAVKHRAESLGYTIKHHVVLTDLEPLVIQRDGFKVESSRSYATSDPRVSVNMGLVVTGRIPDLRKIERLLTPTAQIKNLIRTQAEEGAEQALHSVTPKQFYLHFNMPELSATQSVADEIQQQIVQRLSTRVSADDIQIVFRMQEDRITERITELCRRHRSFKLTVEPHNLDETSENVTYRIVYQVRSVLSEGWHIFLSKNYGSPEKETEAIEEVLGAGLRERLATLPPQYLHFRTWKQKSQLVELFASSLGPVARTFGLEIELLVVNRDSTSAEHLKKLTNTNRLKSASNADINLIEGISQNRLAEYQRLETKKRELLDAEVPADDPTLLDLQTRIDSLMAESLHREPDFGPLRLRGDKEKPEDADELSAFQDLTPLLNPRTTPIQKQLTTGSEDNDEQS